MKKADRVANFLDCASKILLEATSKTKLDCFIEVLHWLDAIGIDVQKDNYSQLIAYTGVYIGEDGEYTLEDWNVD